jgi:hypothetical protein
MEEAKQIINLNFMVDAGFGIISYDTIKASDSFPDKSLEACRRLFMKVHRKYKDKLSALVAILYQDPTSRITKSQVVSEREAESLAATFKVIDLDYVALYLTSKHYTEEFVRNHVGAIHVSQFSMSQSQTGNAPKVQEEEKQLKKIKISQDSDDQKTKKIELGSQSVFSNNSKGKQTLMSFFKKN